MTMNSLPNDLIHEIFSRLPPKSVGRSRCVSKLWCSMLCSKNFTDLFRTRSSARPRLLIAVEKEFGYLFYSSAQPQNPYEKSSLVVAKDFHMNFPKDRHIVSPIYVSGLIYFANMMICNPSTGQLAVLPKLTPKSNSQFIMSYLGFDPIDKQFKVLLVMTTRERDSFIVSKETVHHISTLGTGKTFGWRNIQCPFTHKPFGKEICINGILYYQAEKSHRSGIVCFDVKSEQFKFIDANFLTYWSGTTLINYKGKLGVIDLTYNEVCCDDLDCCGDGGFPIELHMWVLEKQEWSEHLYTLGDDNESVKKVRGMVDVAPEMTATGEIVLSMRRYITEVPYYVFYFNPERNSLHSVEIQGFEEELFHGQRVYVFVNHVEDLNFNFVKTTETSISPPEQKPNPTITSATSTHDHQVRNVAHTQQDHQPRTVAHTQQDRYRYKSIMIFFFARYLLDDSQVLPDWFSSSPNQQ